MFNRKTSNDKDKKADSKWRYKEVDMMFDFFYEEELGLRQHMNNKTVGFKPFRKDEIPGGKPKDRYDEYYNYEIPRLRLVLESFKRQESPFEEAQNQSINYSCEK